MITDMAHFTVWFEREKLAEHDFTSGLIRVGRHPQAEIFLPEESVSRLHALIRIEDERWTLEDPGNTNGLFLNGRQVGDKTALMSGDLIELATYVIQFEHAADLSTDQLVERLEDGLDDEPAAGLRATGREHRDETFRLSKEQVLVQRLYSRQIRGPHLQWLAPGGDRTVVPLGARDVTIGAGDENRIMIPSGIGTARLCATVEERDGLYVLVAAGFWTKVEVRGERLREEHILQDGDGFEIRGTNFVFHSEQF